VLVYLYRAIDQYGQVIDVLVSEKAALGGHPPVLYRGSRSRRPPKRGDDGQSTGPSSCARRVGAHRTKDFEWGSREAAPLSRCHGPDSTAVIGFSSRIAQANSSSAAWAIVYLTSRKLEASRP
jgi:hypothetical protein